MSDGWSLALAVNLPILGSLSDADSSPDSRPLDVRFSNSSDGIDCDGSRHPRGTRGQRASKHGDGTGTVRVLIADDTPGSRTALQALLATFPRVEVVGEATDGAEALCMCFTQRPDIVLMDVRMPGLNGLQATKLIKAKCPETSVIVLSMHARYRAMADAAGADAFLIKGCPASAMMKALEAVLH